MVFISKLLVTAAIILCVIAGTALADSGDGQFEPRWALGWDNGLGMRYKLTTHFELGARISGDYDHGRHSSDDWAYDSVETRAYRTAGGSIGASVLLFHSNQINQWIRFGPYAGLSFTHRSDHDTYYVHYDYNQNDVGIEIGARPSFTFWSRFVFESRIGVVFTHSHVKRERRYSEANLEEQSDGWTLRSFGQNLGLNALMQFMVYF